MCGDLYVRELAFWTSVNLVSKAVSKCEFKTFYKGDEVKSNEYYLWNIEPNLNQSSSVFLHKIVAELFRNNECLVIENDGYLIVADEYERKKDFRRGDTFSNVVIDDVQLNRTYRQSEVLFWQLNSVDMRHLVSGLYSSYSKLISYSMKSYNRSRGTKGIFKYSSIPTVSAEKEAFDELINKKIGQWLLSDNAALPLGNGQEWKELQSKTYSTESTRDIRALVDDVSDFTTKAFGIPPALLRGDVVGVKDVLDMLLTFCIDPLCDILQEEINRKRNGYKGFTEGTYLKIDTATIKHIDILEVSTAIDKLIASGTFSVNGVRRLLGETEIKEGWANEHFITKNYEQLAKYAEGGE